jgi:sugar phosphate isomerase/epimerase
MPIMFAGFHSVGLSQCSVLTTINKVAAAGYKAIELNAETLPWAEPHVTPQTPATERTAIAGAAKRARLMVSAVSAHVPMVEADYPARQNAIKFVNGCIELASDLGAPVVHILSGQTPANVSRDEAWRWFAEAVTATTERSEQAGISLAIEAIVGHLFHSVDDYGRLLADLPGVPFKINFDPSHLVVQGEDPLRIVEKHGGSIVHVHMKDGDGRFPDFTFPPLGKGKVNFERLVSGLVGIGYQGTCSVEYEAQVYGYHESEQTILSHGRNFLSQHGVV